MNEIEMRLSSGRSTGSEVLRANSVDRRRRAHPRSDSIAGPATRARRIASSLAVPMAVPLAMLTAVPLAAAAQEPPTLLASTTGDAGAVVAGLPDLDDSSILRLRENAEPLPFLLEGSWRGMANFAPGDVDGLALRPGYPSYSAGALAFSLLSNEQGFLDGDVLGLAPGGGVEILITEESIAAALGLPGVGIDLDAIAFDEAGQLVFSLQSDQSASVLGDLSNGDVLRLDAGGGVTRLATEADVDAALEQATALSVGVGDVQGVAVVAGELWVVVQGPGSMDGGVLALGANARVVADEVTLGLAGEELDALAVVSDGTEPLSLWVDAPGAEGMGSCRAGTPFGPGVVVASGAAGWESASYAAGVGAWYVDPLDPVLSALLGTGGGYVVFGADGSFDSPFSLPTSGAGLGWDGASGWTFQVLDLTSLRLSAPYRRDL
ncbi:hypothetical protein [Engelhardtia mirabilis]|uniref:Uncharacterized protein n=1 Tax=Engelhardtia mirabilis TaxID=2528011 RepID=A0A518BK02_9BACT|nr:hypothetical protein Pla133_23740 [Planctomycetes bacterium Pla133]QDV01621.1 hypothetical protein Pla86_23730 [Planctomycetes bacterium Pla86]